MPGGTTGLATIEGRVDHEGAGGVLILAVQSDGSASSAVTDHDVDFVIFNVRPGETSVEGYRKGLQIIPEIITLGVEGARDVVLTASADGLGTVVGSVDFVEGGARRRR